MGRTISRAAGSRAGPDWPLSSGLGETEAAWALVKDLAIGKIIGPLRLALIVRLERRSNRHVPPWRLVTGRQHRLLAVGH
jgi:hypothetical protein